MSRLQGYTLGQRHKYYNELLKEAVAKDTSHIPNINYDEEDVDNMLKIDRASHERNVDYILEVFKCNDPLYVSRSINKSTWLVTDPQYSHIINPEYLHNELFPLMKPRSITKLMLYIRRHLKDEVRVKAFYEYVSERNPRAALQWLSNCPMTFIEETVTNRANEIPAKLLKRFCRQSISIFRIYLQKQRSNYDYAAYCSTISNMKHFLKNKDTAEEFLDMAYFSNKFHLNLNAKYTHIAMKNCPKKIKENFTSFLGHIDMTTFVKYVKIEDIKTFVLSFESSLWSFVHLTPFLEKIRQYEVLEFLGVLYKTEYVDIQKLFYAIQGKSYNKMSSDIYRWYRFAPFYITFRDMKKLISAESDPEERHSMLNVLLTCARDDFTNMITVLQYYHDKHINEPYLHKKTFINSLLSQHHTFRFDDDTWDVLNALFYSLEVYIDSTNKVQESLAHIIVHDVLRDEPVHKVVEEKFEVESLILLKNIKSELNADERDKLFNYLYNLLQNRINAQRTDCEISMSEAIEITKGIWTLINDWDKTEAHHEFVINKVVEIGLINHNSPWQHEKEQQERRKKQLPVYTQSLYAEIDYLFVKISKSLYGKNIYETEMVLFATEALLMKALKHNPELLHRETQDMERFLRSYKNPVDKFLNNLRIYWPDSLAIEWTEKFIETLGDLHVHKVLVRAILAIMPYREALGFIEKYAPDANKINWSKANKINLNITKNIGKKMRIVRPQLPVEVVQKYAKGDYLQHALLSLRAMSSNLKPSEIRKYVSFMLDAPVSLQKHGIRLAFDNYNTEEKIEIASNLWKKTWNSSIRVILFTSMFDLLCKEKNAVAVKSIWSVLGSFMDGLSYEENKTIFTTLERVRDVPLTVVGEFYQKSYILLKSLSKKADMSDVLQRIIGYAETFLEYLDNDFVETFLLESITDALANHSESGHVYLGILSTYLLHSKDFDTQMKKYNNLLQPVIDECVTRWVKSDNYLIAGFQTLLQQICSKIPRFVFELKMVMPAEILANIRDALKGSWCLKENYIMIRRWQVTVRYIEALGEMKKEGTHSWETVQIESARVIASICHDFLSKDQHDFFPSIYLIFKDALQILLKDFDIGQDIQLKVLYKMLYWRECPVMYLLVIEMVQDIESEDNDYWKNEIKRKLYSNPSEEVKMHYLRRFHVKYTL